ncbi:hypothetical protein FQN52_001251 [Onygenales sp. PD_12]|nr:hypothetical protein FQN52_001251 [Onygenales sp. PD_12]
MRRATSTPISFLLWDQLLVNGLCTGFISNTSINKHQISVLSFLTAIFMLNPYYQGPEYRNFRLASFVSTALSGFAPVIHGAIIFDRETFNNCGIPFYLLEGALLILAAYIYGTPLYLRSNSHRIKHRIPERWYPGHFDIWGHSHTIFHVLVVIATGVHFYGLLGAFEYDYWNRAVCLV